MTESVTTKSISDEQYDYGTFFLPDPVDLLVRCGVWKTVRWRAVYRDFPFVNSRNRCFTNLELNEKEANISLNGHHGPKMVMTMEEYVQIRQGRRR